MPKLSVAMIVVVFFDELEIRIMNELENILGKGNNARKEKKCWLSALSPISTLVSSVIFSQGCSKSRLCG